MLLHSLIPFCKVICFHYAVKNDYQSNIQIYEVSGVGVLYIDMWFEQRVLNVLRGIAVK